MNTQLSPHHPIASITQADLHSFANLVPPSGSALLRMLGIPAGLSLLNAWAGVQVVVPKGPCNNPGGAKRWAQMVALIGEEAMFLLSSEMGGEVLEVPTCDALRKERRNHAIRTQFDYLTAKAPAGEGLSKSRAVQELGLSHAPITWRQLETILDRPSAEPSSQNNLFSDIF